MKRLLPLLALPLLTACPWDKKQETAAIQTPCFDIVNVTQGPVSLRPILINKCTGETWIALYGEVSLEDSKKGMRYSWYRMEKSYIENATDAR